MENKTFVKNQQTTSATDVGYLANNLPQHYNTVQRIKWNVQKDSQCT
jgi:hypothetical protein